MDERTVMGRVRRAGLGALVGFLGLAAGFGTAAAEGVVNGAGSTAVFPLMNAWAQAYQEKTGTPITYQPNGGGAGVAQFDENSVTFVLVEDPASPAELQKNGFVQWPLVFTGIVPVVNLPGLQSGKLVLDGPTLGSILDGKITRWNDPAIVALNQGLTLPDAPIVVVNRAEPAGSSFALTRYLSATSPAFDAQIGPTDAPQFVKGPTASGDAGMASEVASTPNAIGWTDYADAVAAKLPLVSIKTTAGAVVAPTPATFAQAVGDLTGAFDGGLGFADLMIDQSRTGGWPILATTFVLMDAVPDDRASGEAALKFFDWAYRAGSAQATQLGYVPVPATLLNGIETLWSAAIIIDDKPLWPAK